jgi:small GTP-binding protein
MNQISKKVCMLGDFAVGKTSLVERFVYNRFSTDYVSSIGVRVSRKAMIMPQAGGVAELAILLWDIAGHNGVHKAILPSYLRGASGAVLVCDLTRPESLAALHDYARMLLSYSPDAVIVLAANKSDQRTARRLPDDELDQAASALRATRFVTSAREGDEVEQLFRTLGRQLLAGDVEPDP